MSACISIKLHVNSKIKNKPAHNRTKHDATAQYDDDDDNSVLQYINLIKDGDIAYMYNCP